MKLKRIYLASAVALLAAAAGTIAAVAGGTGKPAPPTFSPGVPVARGAFSHADQAFLARIGATGQITRLGSRDGVAFYSVTSSDNGRCFATGTITGGLSGGCLDASKPVPQVVDLSALVMNPADASWRLETLQGVAAEGIAKVGFVDAAGALHATRVTGNVYRLSGQSWQGGSASELRAFDARGNLVFSESVGGAS
jgi:hypothetical protein